MRRSFWIYCNRKFCSALVRHDAEAQSTLASKTARAKPSGVADLSAARSVEGGWKREQNLDARKRREPLPDIGSDANDVATAGLPFGVLEIDAIAEEAGVSPRFDHGGGVIEKAEDDFMGQGGGLPRIQAASQGEEGRRFAGSGRIMPLVEYPRATVQAMIGTQF